MKKGTIIKLLFATHLYQYYTKDGLVIANSVKVSPYKLYMWSQSPEWRQALAVWGGKRKSNLEGEIFHSLVERSGRMRIRRIATKSLSKARELWRRLIRRYDIGDFMDVLDIEHEMWEINDPEDEADRKAIKDLVSKKWYADWGTESNKELLYHQQRGACAGCQKFFEITDLTRDHIVPKSKGGPNDISNIQLLCELCNRIKSDKTNEYLIAVLKERNIIRQNGNLLEAQPEE